MNRLLAALAISLGFSAACVVALIWATREETLAELPDAHDPAMCDACAAAGDYWLARFDVELWDIEMEPTS